MKNIHTKYKYVTQFPDGKRFVSVGRPEVLNTAFGPLLYSNTDIVYKDIDSVLLDIRMQAPMTTEIDHFVGVPEAYNFIAINPAGQKLAYTRKPESYGSGWQWKFIDVLQIGKVEDAGDWENSLIERTIKKGFSFADHVHNHRASIGESAICTQCATIAQHNTELRRKLEVEQCAYKTAYDKWETAEKAYKEAHDRVVEMSNRNVTQTEFIKKLQHELDSRPDIDQHYDLEKRHKAMNKALMAEIETVKNLRSELKQSNDTVNSCNEALRREFAKVEDLRIENIALRGQRGDPSDKAEIESLQQTLLAVKNNIEIGHELLIQTICRIEKK